MEKTKLEGSIEKALTYYIDNNEEYDEGELQILSLQKEEIIIQLMNADFRDKGALVAMRGFVYQYYTAIYYILLMISPNKDSWWHSVILEYFDDVSLIGENKIRFIQVKTIKENGSKVHQISDFTNRSDRSNKENPNKKFYFNSWIDKIFANYDYFVRENNDVNNFFDIKKIEFQPEFEMVTNNYFILKKLEIYQNNIDFDLHDVSLDDDVLKKTLLKTSNNIEFEDAFNEEIDFYLNKLKLTSLGSTVELSVTIINIIQEYIQKIDIIKKGDIRAESISTYIFDNLLTYVIKNSHEDNEEKIKKNNLVISEILARDLILNLAVEARELISSDTFNDSAYQLFKEVFVSLQKEFACKSSNLEMNGEMLGTLESLNKIILEKIETDSSYCLKVLNKIFNGDNSIIFWDLETSNIRSELTESIRFIIYFLVFCKNHSEKYGSAKFFFHEGIFNDYLDNILFTIYHARSKLNKKDSIEKIKFMIDECEDSRSITFELYCLLVGTKSESDSSNEKFAQLSKLIGSADIHKITNVPSNLKFIDSINIDIFIEEMFNSGDKLDSFRDNEVISVWKQFLEKESLEIKEKHIEV